MNLGILVISITVLGAFSNWLNWRYLNYSVVRLLYCLGAFVHELSHAIVCFFTGAKITEIKVFSQKPHVIHSKSKLPLAGEILISLAPIAGGLLVLFLINKYFLVNQFAIPEFSDWHSVFVASLQLLSQINLLSWQSWLMVLLFLNVGAMIGPSWQDLKNIWPAIFIFFFFNHDLLGNLGLMVIILILTNILIQLILILLIWIINFCRNWYNRIKVARL